MPVGLGVGGGAATFFAGSRTPTHFDTGCCVLVHVSCVFNTELARSDLFIYVCSPHAHLYIYMCTYIYICAYTCIYIHIRCMK